MKDGPCDRCRCPEICLRWPVFCEWAKGDDPVQLRTICDRSARGESHPPVYPSLMNIAVNAVGAVARVATTAVTGQPVFVSAEVAAARLRVCQGHGDVPACDKYDPVQVRCTHSSCGCFLAGLAGKTGLATEDCPLHKWPA